MSREVAADMANLAGLLLEDGPQDALEEAQDLLLTALRWWRMERLWDLYASGLGLLRVVLKRAIVVLDDMLLEVAEALSASMHIASLQTRAVILEVAAALTCTQKSAAGPRNRTIPLALQAIAH